VGAISARTIAATNRQHVTAVKLDAGLVDLINAYARFDLPTYWGSGRSAAADGTLINLYENNLLSAKHVRYGAYGGIAYYHIADTYIALFSHFISVGVWEAVYIIDGLLKNDSSVQPETLHADTQGQSLPVFGLTWLMGIELMPRIRNWKDLTLYRPSRRTRYRHIDSLFTDTIGWDLLITHWQDLMQVVLSIQAGKLLPSTLLRKLGNHSHKNKLYRAFRELGRVVRTVFLLRFISDEPLQRQVTVETNKVEAYHNFREWIAFGHDSEMTTNDPIEWEKRIKYRDC
jgi:TnpA family transposase